ncbi:hypothetical protein ACFOU2_17815 [Bacillus songklensis]|uniref:Signal peptidase I n=1 Tax=Bacillus songklensis TaxID=1069116 RepID=A0ABV8B4G5_9BACI
MMSSKKNDRVFSFFRYILVLYVVVFTMLFAALIPVAFGFQVSIFQAKYENGKVPNGSIVVSRHLEEGTDHPQDLIVMNKDAKYSLQTTKEWKETIVETNKEANVADSGVVKGKYLYHIPYVGYVVQPLKKAMTPIFMCCILLYVFTYTIHHSKTTKCTEEKSK